MRSSDGLMGGGFAVMVKAGFHVIMLINGELF